ncbi:MAG: Mur ligase family protein [Candidatus Pacebacteria bacterium]|nr:Mur ligase family protein [Candidatus Paceibacterota bacterium]
MFYLLSFLWFLRTTKAILFWIYLWQLKEYHLGRFFDHFRTEKGKRLIYNKLNVSKLVLVFIFPFLPLLIFFLLLLFYIAESFKVLVDLLKSQLRKPVLTLKTIFLILIGIFIEFLFLFTLSLKIEDITQFAFLLLCFDVLTPVITSLFVLLFQPMAVLGRNRIIKKAKEKRAKSGNLLVIGITGSYGKTSTKEFLYTILSQKYRVLETKEHQNSEVGIARCLLNDLKPEHEIFIVEMGAYGKGGIKLLCDIVKPKIGIITGVNEQHLATFGSMENLLSAEGGGELVESLPEDGSAFFNGKNKYCRELYEKTKIKKFLYGQNVGLQGLENIEGAKMVAKEIGMTEEEIEKAVNKIENKFPGIIIKNGINGLKIIDATYSANPDSVIAHLEYAKTLPGKKILVMPCLIELGKASEEVHRRIGQKIAQLADLAIITTKDRFKEIQEGAGQKAIFLENPEEIFKKIKSFCKEGDTVLLESRVPIQLIKQLEL